jgi:hypothetical protein
VKNAFWQSLHAQIIYNMRGKRASLFALQERGKPNVPTLSHRRQKSATSPPLSMTTCFPCHFAVLRGAVVLEMRSDEDATVVMELRSQASQMCVWLRAGQVIAAAARGPRRATAQLETHVEPSLPPTGYGRAPVHCQILMDSSEHPLPNHRSTSSRCCPILH